MPEDAWGQRLTLHTHCSKKEKKNPSPGKRHVPCTRFTCFPLTLDETRTKICRLESVSHVSRGFSPRNDKNKYAVKKKKKIRRGVAVNFDLNVRNYCLILTDIHIRVAHSVRGRPAATWREFDVCITYRTLIRLMSATVRTDCWPVLS